MSFEFQTNVSFSSINLNELALFAWSSRSLYCWENPDKIWSEIIAKMELRLHTSWCWFMSNDNSDKFWAEIDLPVASLKLGQGW